MGTASLSSLSQRALILLMGAVAIIPLLPVTLYLPVLPEVADGLGYEVETFQLTLPLFVMSQVLAMPVIAMLSDLGYRLQALYWALGLFILGTLFCLVASHLWIFCIGRIFQALSAAALMTVVPALIDECYDNNTVARVLSYVTAIGFLIPMLGPEASSLISAQMGWRYVFGFMLAYGSLVFLACYLCIGKAKKSPQHHPTDYWRESLRHWFMMLKDRHTLAFLVCNTGVAVVCQIYVSNSDFLYREYYQIEELSYSYLLSALFLTRMLVTIANGLLLKHFRYQRIIDRSIPILIGVTASIFLIDWLVESSLSINLILPVALFALSGFVVTNAMAGVLQNNSLWAMQATALLFVIFSAAASVINTALILSHDGTPKMLSLFSLLILLLTYLLFLMLKPGK